MKPQERAWMLSEHDRKRVVVALKEGCCDGILPAARTFVDGFAGFLHRSGLLPLFEPFPHHRDHRSIAPFFFCHTRLYRPLFRVPRLAQVGDTLVRSPFILRLLGFNARQVQRGFYEGSGEKPFDPEAWGEFFALATDNDFFAHPLAWLEAIPQTQPEVFRPGLWEMDGFHFLVPKGGHGIAAGDDKTCGGRLAGRRGLASALATCRWNRSDLPLGKEVLTAALRVLGKGTLRPLLVDAGFLDGDGLAQLSESMTGTIRLREDRALSADLQGLALMEPETWEGERSPSDPRTRRRRSAGDYRLLGMDEWVGMPCAVERLAHPGHLCQESRLLGGGSDRETRGRSTVPIESVGTLKNCSWQPRAIGDWKPCRLRVAA